MYIGWLVMETLCNCRRALSCWPVWGSREAYSRGGIISWQALLDEFCLEVARKPCILQQAKPTNMSLTFLHPRAMATCNKLWSSIKLFIWPDLNRLKTLLRAFSLLIPQLFRTLLEPHLVNQVCQNGFGLLHFFWNQPQTSFRFCIWFLHIHISG